MNKATQEFIERVFEFVPRPMDDSSLGYVISTWERSLRPEYMDAENVDFGRAVRKRINQLILDGATFTLAVKPDDPNAIIGWICFDAHQVHYVYVRNTYRRVGVARRLVALAGVPTTPISATHLTKSARDIRATHPIRYLPQL